jgi:hypothetical protein
MLLYPLSVINHGGLVLTPSLASTPWCTGLPPRAGRRAPVAARRSLRAGRCAPVAARRSLRAGAGMRLSGGSDGLVLPGGDRYPDGSEERLLPMAESQNWIVAFDGESVGRAGAFALGMWCWRPPHPPSAPRSGAVRAGCRLSEPHPYLHAHESQILSPSGDFQPAQWTPVPALVGTMCHRAGKIRQQQLPDAPFSCLLGAD